MQSGIISGTLTVNLRKEGHFQHRDSHLHPRVWPVLWPPPVGAPAAVLQKWLQRGHWLRDQSVYTAVLWKHKPVGFISNGRGVLLMPDSHKCLALYP